MATVLQRIVRIEKRLAAIERRLHEKLDLKVRITEVKGRNKDGSWKFGKTIAR